MTKTCYLHIGTGKTGTTSIQSTCHVNAERLAQMGLLYPGDVTEHYLLSTLFMANPRPIRRYAQLGQPLEKMLDDARALEARIRAEVKAQPDHNVLISSEDFFTLGQHGYDALLDFAYDLAPSVRVICYVRHPFGRALSGLQQVIKMGRKTLAEFDPAEFHESITDRLIRIEDQSDAENLILRRFEPDALYRGDVVADILHTLGLSDAHLDQIDYQRTNESLSHEGLLVADALTRLFPAPPGGWNEDRSVSVHRTLKSIRGARFALSEEQTTEVMRVSAQEAARLEERFGLAFKPPRPPSPGTLWGQEAIDDVARLINQLALDGEAMKRRIKTQSRNGRKRKARIAELEAALARKRFFGLGRLLQKRAFAKPAEAESEK